MPPPLKENLEIIAGMVAIFVLDVVAGAEISYGTAFTSSASQTIGIIDDIGAVIFVIITVLAIIAILINRRSVVLRIFVLYLLKMLNYKMYFLKVILLIVFQKQ